MGGGLAGFSGGQQRWKGGCLAAPTQNLHALPSHPPSACLQVCLEYLERYFTLICFCSYITGTHFPPATPASLTFGEWLGARPELRSILERLLRYNPAAALGLNKPPDALAASECGGVDGGVGRLVA